MIFSANGPAAKRWPFLASLPAQKKPVAVAVVAPASGGSGGVPAHVVLAWRFAHPELAAALDKLRAAA